jgi:hypothetical protein
MKPADPSHAVSKAALNFVTTENRRGGGESALPKAKDRNHCQYAITALFIPFEFPRPAIPLESL